MYKVFVRLNCMKLVIIAFFISVALPKFLYSVENELSRADLTGHVLKLWGNIPEDLAREFTTFLVGKFDDSRIVTNRNNDRVLGILRVQSLCKTSLKLVIISYCFLLSCYFS